MGVVGVTAALLAVPVAAHASGEPCTTKSATIASSSGRVQGTGSWTCLSGFLPATVTAHVEVWHYYFPFPTEVFYGQGPKTASTSTFSYSTKRCDQSTTADYYAVAYLLGSGISTTKQGSMVNVTTCAGTGG